MISEIKFRALFFSDNEWVDMTLEDIAKLGDAFINYKHWRRFTGLKDKNGKEIFEGDIVKDTYYTSIIRFGIADVEDNEMYRSNIVCGFYKEDIKTGEERHMDHIESSEVIGNIWENPDLLKGEPNE